MRASHLFRRLLASALVSVQAGAILLCLNFQSHAQNNDVLPANNLVAEGIPPIPRSLVNGVKRYSGIYELPLAGWDPVKREIWLKGISSAAWISRVPSPGMAPQVTSTYIKESGIYDLYYQPQGRYLVYNKDSDGNEMFQFYLYDLQTRTSSLISDGRSRDTEPVWSNKGNQIVYGSTPKGGVGVSLFLMSPIKGNDGHLLAPSSGTYLKAFDWSPDDHWIVYCDFVSNIASSLSIANIETGKTVALSPASQRKEYYDYPVFSKDGKGVYVITDHDSDMRRLAYLDIGTREIRYLSADPKWDVDGFQLSSDGKTIALTTNEDGISKLHILNVSTGQDHLVSGLPIGQISDLKWHNNSVDLAFNFKSHQAPNDIYSVDTKTFKTERWTRANAESIRLADLSEPELIHWKSFDDRSISGFIYRPPSKFTGKRPVIVDIHGGPEEQYRPDFLYEQNYLINELGVAKIYPNVRGSSGYGRTFLDLDNGIHREDAVKDIGALLDWIKKQPGLDENRVMVEGGSYGGYLALSAIVKYDGRIRAAISDCGPSDLASFIEHTEGWRRGLQRAEFGDEQNPQIRGYLEKIAPLNNAQKIKSPLMIIQGLNDPRVPANQSEEIVKAVKKNATPVWYLLAKNEGHGFAQANNRDFSLYSSFLFTQEFLLK